MKAICVVNPKASDGSCLGKWPFIESLLVEAGVECALVSREGDLRDVVADVLAEAAGEAAVLAAVGGDGTQHAVVNGIMRFRKERPDANVPSYVPIPMGTGNNIAKSLFRFPVFSGRNGGIKAAVAAIARGEERRVDLGLVRTGGDDDGTWFLDAFSIGADAAILAAKDAASAKLAADHPIAMTWLKGYPLYAWHGVRTLFSMRRFECEVEVDGKLWHSGALFNLLVNDTAIYGGEFDLTRTGFPDDGKLDALVFSTAADFLWKYLSGYRRLPRVLRRVGSLSNGESALKSGKAFKIKTGAAVAAQVDGERLSPGDDFEITSHSRVLKILVASL